MMNLIEDAKNAGLKVDQWSMLNGGHTTIEGRLGTVKMVCAAQGLDIVRHDDNIDAWDVKNGSTLLGVIRSHHTTRCEDGSQFGFFHAA